MRVFVSYKYSGLDKDQVRHKMTNIRKSLNALDINSFIHCLDSENDSDPDVIFSQLEREIFGSDSGLVYIDDNIPSAGMYMEISIMKSNNMPFVVFLSKDVKDTHFFSGLADEVIVFDGNDDFQEKLLKYYGIEYMRDIIDGIDSSIISLLHERLKCIKIIGKYKKIKGLPILQENRWKDLLEEKNVLAEQYGLDKELIENVWTAIHDNSIKAQENLDN